MPGSLRSSVSRGDDGRVRLYAVLAHDEASVLSLLTTDVGESYQALTPDCPQAHWFEREIAEQFGLVPSGHPWLKPIRFHRSYRPGHDAWSRTAAETIQPSVPPAGADFFRVEGHEVHEVAVGPVHAGVIEPGHFRFQCHGEHVFHLEISLGYQHRGVERALVGGPNKRTIHLMEQVAGDTSVGHATAYCQALEALAGARPSLRAQSLRGVALELERLANHTGDIGALAGDVGFLPTASYCGRIRGDFLNATALMCGSRFGRGLVRPGGVAWDIDAPRAEQLAGRCEVGLADVIGAANLLWNSLSVQSRFEDTGLVERLDRRGAGPGRAGGAGQRHRPGCSPRLPYRHLPLRLYPDFHPTHWRCLRPSFRPQARDPPVCRLREQQLRGLPDGPARVPCGALLPNALVVSLVEGGAAKSATWRSPTRPAGSRTTRSSTRRSTTGWGWHWRCGISRFRIFRSATKASTSLTADTTCEPEGPPMLNIIRERIRQGRRTIAYPAGDPPPLPDRFRGLPVAR